MRHTQAPGLPLPVRTEVLYKNGMGSFVSIAGFLNEIRGTKLELDVPGGPVHGRPMTADVRRKELGSGGTAEALEVTVLAAGGELRTVDLAAAKSVRLRESQLLVQGARLAAERSWR